MIAQHAERIRATLDAELTRRQQWLDRCRPRSLNYWQHQVREIKLALTSLTTLETEILYLTQQTQPQETITEETQPYLITLPDLRKEFQ